MLPFREITCQHSILNCEAQELHGTGPLLRLVFHADRRNLSPRQDRWFKACGKAVKNSTTRPELGWDWGVDGGFQGGHFMDGEVGFDGLRVGLQMVDPRVVTLLLRGHRVLLLTVHRAH